MQSILTSNAIYKTVKIEIRKDCICINDFFIAFYCFFLVRIEMKSCLKITGNNSPLRDSKGICR